MFVLAWKLLGAGIMGRRDSFLVARASPFLGVRHRESDPNTIWLETELWLATSFHAPFCRTNVSVLRTVFDAVLARVPFHRRS